jgi:hypothetical protein
MKTATIGIALLALALLPALPHGATASAGMHCGHHVHWAGHHDPSDARMAITTENGEVTLLITDRVVAMQLSDRTLRRVNRELRDKENRDDNPLGAVIASVVLSTVREMIDNSFECRVRDLRDVTYENGRLEFIARDGRHVFGHVDISDTEVESSFSPEDARRFVQEFRRVKAGR